MAVLPQEDQEDRSCLPRSHCIPNPTLITQAGSASRRARSFPPSPVRAMPTLHQQEDQEDQDRHCLLPLEVLHQSRALATCLHAPDLSRLSLSSHACQSFWSQVQSLHVPFFQYSLLSRDSVNKTRTDGFRRACQQGQLVNVVNLSLHGANLVDKDLDRLADEILPYLPQLEVLDLSHNPSLGYPGLTHLACSHRAPPPKLHDLRLAHNSDMCRGPRGGAHLGRLLLQLWARLKCLDLTQTGATDETLRTAVRLFNSIIERCREAEEQRGDEEKGNGTLQLLPRLGFAGLRELRLGQNLLQGLRGGQALTEALLLNSNNSKGHPLEVLVLDDCYMGDEGLTFIAESALMLGQFWSLRELHLQNNRCGPGGARALGKACVEGLPALEFLGLRMNMMGNAGALALVEGMMMVGEEWEDGREGGEERCLPRLKKVDLSHNMIDAVGVKGVLAVLLAPGPYPSLEEVDLSHNAVREKEASELQNAIRFSSNSSTTSTITTTSSSTTITNVTTFLHDEKTRENVRMILSPPGLYCQVLLEGEEGGEREEQDALIYRLMLSVSDFFDFAFDLYLGEDEK